MRVAMRLAAALPLLMAGPLLAQDSADTAARPATETAAAQPIDEVIVRGRRLGEIDADLRIHIDTFLDQVAKPNVDRGYARWDRAVCVGVHNLERSAAQYIVDRISALALDVGLEPGEPGCSPQVNVMFTTAAKELSAQLVEREPRLFRYAAGFLHTDLGQTALDEFVASDKAVRWWHVNLPVDAKTGAAAIQTPSMRGMCGTQNGGNLRRTSNCPPTISVNGPSRVHSGIVDELQAVIIIVDGTKVRGTTWQQVADYLAVVALAQINPDANPADYDSILNLFQNPAAYSGLTDWDRSYVRALYAIDQERAPGLQHNEIVTLIAKRELGYIE